MCTQLGPFCEDDLFGGVVKRSCPIQCRMCSCVMDSDCKSSQQPYCMGRTCVRCRGHSDCPGGQPYCVQGGCTNSEPGDVALCGSTCADVVTRFGCEFTFNQGCPGKPDLTYQPALRAAEVDAVSTGYTLCPSLCGLPDLWTVHATGHHCSGVGLPLEIADLAVCLDACRTDETCLFVTFSPIMAECYLYDECKELQMAVSETTYRYERGGACPRPDNFCYALANEYTYTDCDGDGVEDHYCVDEEGNSGVIESASGCLSTWPDGICERLRPEVAEEPFSPTTIILILGAVLAAGTGICMAPSYFKAFHDWQKTKVKYKIRSRDEDAEEEKQHFSMPKRGGSMDRPDPRGASKPVEASRSRFAGVRMPGSNRLSAGAFRKGAAPPRRARTPDAEPVDTPPESAREEADPSVRDGPTHVVTEPRGHRGPRVVAAGPGPAQPTAAVPPPRQWAVQLHGPRGPRRDGLQPLRTHPQIGPAALSPPPKSDTLAALRQTGRF